jgi:hypothetical protein
MKILSWETIPALVTQVSALAEHLWAGGLQVESVLCYDTAATAITDAARRSGADWIVLATHGRFGVGRWRQGSVADQVARQSVSPVLVIPVGCRNAIPRRWASSDLSGILVDDTTEQIAPSDQTTR